MKCFYLNLNLRNKQGISLTWQHLAFLTEQEV